LTVVTDVRTSCLAGGKVTGQRVQPVLEPTKADLMGG
jgi:hypothetical protein